MKNFFREIFLSLWLAPVAITLCYWMARQDPQFPKNTGGLGTMLGALPAMFTFAALSTHFSVYKLKKQIEELEMKLREKSA